MNVWSRIKRFYFEKFGYSDELVELVASSQILKLCASGCSNRQVADVLQLDIDVVIEEIEKWLSADGVVFSGWEYQLDIDPLALWRKVQNGTATIEEAGEALNVLEENMDICARYLAIESLMLKEWK